MDTNAERLARIEEGIKGMHKKIDDVKTTQDNLENTQTRQAIKLAIIESRGATWKTVLSVSAVLIAASGGIFALFNQLYGGLP